ncbi:hypothetical protein [Streptomyces sp. HUAS TT7]|uniref:hypothetical protein n=1 Tax=Streptomyces sp. HUAS TT7 TaxID=3447507 RepID=UPI003F657903
MVVQSRLLNGGENWLIDLYYTAPGKEEGAILCIGDGANRWALVHIDDIAELYVAALTAKAGSGYVGVGGVSPTAKDVALAVSRRPGIDGKVESFSLAQARERMGVVSDAFTLDQ